MQQPSEVDLLIRDGVTLRMILPYVQELFKLHDIDISHGASNVSVSWRDGVQDRSMSFPHAGKAYEFAMSRVALNCNETKEIE